MAQTADAYQPARFTDSRRSLQHRIRFPRIDGNITVELLCDARISKRGTFTSNYCTAQHERAGLFQRAVANVIDRAKIKSATINGEAMNVFMQYRIVFDRTDEQTSIRAYPNHGLHRKTHGDDYSSAQSYHLGSWNGCSKDVYHYLVGEVDVAGRARNVRVAEGSFSSRECEQMSTGLLLRRRFIPAQADGEPFKSVYAELFFSYDMAKVSLRPTVGESAPGLKGFTP